MSPRPTALVVDDQPLILMDTADLVSEEGYAVIEARTADEAYEVLGRNPTIRLLITDVQMPGELDGFALAREAASQWPYIKVVVVSGAATPGPDELPSEVRFIPKPLSLDLVREVLREEGGSV